MNQDDKSRIETMISELALAGLLKLTVHAHAEMIEEDITAAELSKCLINCALLENYPDHKRGACCLVCGQGETDRYLHVVCTSDLPELIIITVYEPKFPKWETPYKRGMRL